MPLVGLCGEPKEALEKIEYMMQALSLQGQFSEEDPVQSEKNRQTEFVRITEKSAEALEALDCLIWWGSCENVLSEEVESPSSDGRIRVREKEILYLESMRHEIWVHCEKKVFLTSETLGYWEEKLRVRSFLRVHKSFLVNPGQISRIGRKMIELEDGSRLPVSRYRYPEVMARYEAWIRHAEFLE